MTTELDLQIRQTSAFIDRSPTDLVIRRQPNEDDGQGGTISGDPEDLPSQRVSVVGLRIPRVVTTPEGKEETVEKSVIGLPAFDVLIGDEFNHGGTTFEVIIVNREPAWRVVAEAASRG